MESQIWSRNKKLSGTKQASPENQSLNRFLKF
jgi:hypothetical protein